jgi:hypothetical protein
MTDDLIRALTPELQKAAKAFGNEFFFHYSDVTKVIALATDQGIAILGLEFFELKDGRLQSITFTAYDLQLHFTGDWRTFVKASNEQALQFVEANPGNENEVYILTSISHAEFCNLRPIVS